MRQYNYAERWHSPIPTYFLCFTKAAYRVAQKSKPPPIFQKIVLKIANEIRFIREVIVWIKHYNTIRW